MKNVFITGASGLLGSWVAKELSEEGFNVVGLKRKTSQEPPFLKNLKNFQWAEAELIDPLQIEKLLDGIDTIIHSGAVISFNASNREEMYQTNVIGTQILVDLAHQKNVDYFLHVSSVAAVGRSKVENELDEKFPWEENEYITHYARSKYFAEKEVWRGFSEGLRGAIVNPSVILGPSKWDQSSAKLMGYVNGESKFFTSGKLNLVDVRDVTSAIKTIINNNIQGERYILSGEQLFYKDFFEMVGHKLNKKAPYIRIGKPLAQLARIPENIISWLIRKNPFLTSEIINGSFSSHKYSSEKFKKQFNYSFKPIEESIEWACKEMMLYNVEKKTSP